MATAPSISIISIVTASNSIPMNHNLSEYDQQAILTKRGPPFR
jgi:hypothetical protein